LLPRRVRLESDGREKTAADGLIGLAYDFRRRQIAFPKFKSELAELGLIGDGSENEAAVRFQIVVLEKFAPAFEREIIRADEFSVKRVALRVDVVDSLTGVGLLRPVNDEHQVRQRVKA